MTRKLVKPRNPVARVVRRLLPRIKPSGKVYRRVKHAHRDVA
jgi:hypothetical protein